MKADKNRTDHLVVQSVQVIEAVGDAGQVVVPRVLLIGRSGQVAAGWVGIGRHHHGIIIGVQVGRRGHVTIIRSAKGESVEVFRETEASGICE